MSEKTVGISQNYIRDMRKVVGHAPLMCTACGVIIENEREQILLQKRKDNGKWCLPGGCMEMGEKFIETAKREVFEETGLVIDGLSLFGIYSGEDRIITYPNGDVCCITGVVFITRGYSGEILQETEEAVRHSFFSRDGLPEELNPFDRKYILAWRNGGSEIVVD